MNIDYYVFSGTGNTLKMAETVAAALTENGCEVAIKMIEDGFQSPKGDTVIGIAFPVAFFSTYPVVQEFIEQLPVDNGRKIFLTATMGGSGGGLEYKFRCLVAEKGYTPIASRLFKMPSNYYPSGKINRDENAAIVEKMEKDAVKFAQNLLTGKAEWCKGIPVVSSFWYWIMQSRNGIKLFNKLMPLRIEDDKCVKCMVCKDNCPSDSIYVEEGLLRINRDTCQACQRCIGFCPSGAINTEKGTAAQYSAVSLSEFKKHFA